MTQQIPRAAPDAVGHDWSARARSTAMDALRYTQFVGVMKRALPAAAFAIIAAVLAFFFVQRQPARMSMTYEKLGTLQNDLTMSKPRLTGVDGKGNPFVITADAAIQDAKNPKRARLTKIEADLEMDKKGWLNAEAGGGLVDMKAGTLELNGGISLFSDAGYELHTQAASLDLNEGMVHGHQEITGQGPLGTMRADEFHFDRDSDLLVLSGHVHMTLVSAKK
jgi:lipopolysaccharide export system protein LptC